MSKFLQVNSENYIKNITKLCMLRKLNCIPIHKTLMLILKSGKNKVPTKSETVSY